MKRGANQSPWWWGPYGMVIGSEDTALITLFALKNEEILKDLGAFEIPLNHQMFQGIMEATATDDIHVVDGAALSEDMGGNFAQSQNCSALVDLIRRCTYAANTTIRRRKKKKDSADGRVITDGSGIRQLLRHATPENLKELMVTDAVMQIREQIRIIAQKNSGSKVKYHAYIEFAYFPKMYIVLRASDIIVDEEKAAPNVDNDENDVNVNVGNNDDVRDDDIEFDEEKSFIHDVDAQTVRWYDGMGQTWKARDWFGIQKLIRDGIDVTKMRVVPLLLDDLKTIIDCIKSDPTERVKTCEVTINT